MLSRLLAPGGVLMALLLAGCDTLSRDGPSEAAISGGAATTVKAEAGQPVFDYVLMDIDQKALGYFGKAQGGSLYGTFGGGRGPVPEIVLGVGDSLQITIFESAVGGLFLPREAGIRPGNYVTLPPQAVDKEGNVTVPYAGPIKAAGQSIPALQAAIVAALKDRAIEPQVVVTLGTQRASQVSIVGQVNSPRQVDVNPSGDRILDAIARAGGITHPGYETYVTLQRGRSKVTVFFDQIIADPRENIYVRPGDVVYVYREPQTFLAFGATGTSGQVEFLATSLTLGEGVARVGGLEDQRADPSQVYVYRGVPRSRLVKAGVDLAKFPPSQSEIPVVFKANFRDPASYFAAQKFYLQHRDVVYVSNSSSYELYKFLTLLDRTSNTVAAVPANALTAKQSINALGH